MPESQREGVARSLVLSPHLSEVTRARAFLSHIAAEAGFDDDRVFDIAVAISEAAANAIEHAPIKGKVEVTAVLYPDRLEVQVEGPGDFQTPDRRKERASRGLGLPLVAKLADHLALYSGPTGGTLVALTFYRPGAGGEDEGALPPSIRELIEESELVSAITSTAPVGLYVVDPELRFRWANPAYQDFLDEPYRRLDLTGLSVAEVIPGAGEGGILDFLGGVSREGVGRTDSEYEFGGFSRGITYWRWEALPLKQERDEPPFDVLVVIWEITEQVEQRRRLEELNGQLQAVFDTMTEALTVTDVGGTLVRINAEARRVYGMDRGEGVGRTLADWPEFELADLEGNTLGLDAYPAARVLRGESFTGLDLKVRDHRTGSERLWRFGGAPVRDQRGEVALAVMVFQDITVARQAEDDLARQGRELAEKTRFLEGVLDNAGVAIAILEGPELRYRLVNRTYQALLPQEPMLGRTFAEVFPELAEAGIDADLRRVIETGVTWTVSPAPVTAAGRPEGVWEGNVVRLSGGPGMDASALIVGMDVTERHRYERAVKESEERYRSLFENMSEGFVVGHMLYDDGGRAVDYQLTEANAGYERLTGMPREESLRRTMKELIPALEDVWVEHHARAAETGEPQRWEAYNEQVGQHYEIHTFSPQPGEFASVFVNISERKQLLERLAADAELLDRLYGSLPVMLVMWDPHLRRFTLNRHTEEVLGWTTADANEGDFMAKVYPDPEYRAEVEAYMQSLEPGWKELTVTAKDGRPVPSEWANIRLTDDTSIGVGVDLSARRRAEDAAAQSEEKFSKAFHGSATFLCISELETGTLIEFNEAYCRLTGYSTQELAGRSTLELGIAVPEQRAVVVEQIRAGGGVRDMEVDIVAKSGERRTCLFSAELVHCEGKSCLISSGVDITERKGTEEAMREAQERGAQELARVQLLSEVAAVLAGSLDVAEMARQVLLALADKLGARLGSFYTLAPDGRTLVHLAHIGFPAGVETSFNRVPLDDSSNLGYVLARDIPYLTHDQAPDPEGSRIRAKEAAVEDDRWLILPLRVAGELLGGMVLSFAGRRPFEPDEVALYQAVAAQVSVALRNARLYEEQKSIAESLQMALLTIPGRIGRVRVGHLYRSATAAAQVGGDFYDVIELRGGEIAVLIGDVAGHGIQAARTATLVKDVVDAFLHQPEDVGGVLRRTNHLLLDKRMPGFVSLFLAVLDPQSGRLSYCSAGHPSTLLRRASGVVELLGEGSPPLGVLLDAMWTPVETELRPGDALLLYTDGVIEARGGQVVDAGMDKGVDVGMDAEVDTGAERAADIPGDGESARGAHEGAGPTRRDAESRHAGEDRARIEGRFFGEERLQRLLAGWGGELEDLPQAILDQVLTFTSGTLQDDLALVALSFGEEPPQLQT